MDSALTVTGNARRHDVNGNELPPDAKRKMEDVKRIQHALLPKLREGFFGRLTATIQNGRIAHVITEQTQKAEDLKTE